MSLAHRHSAMAAGRWPADRRRSGPGRPAPPARPCSQTPAQAASNAARPDARIGRDHAGEHVAGAGAGQPVRRGGADGGAAVRRGDDRVRRPCRRSTAPVCAAAARARSTLLPSPFAEQAAELAFVRGQDRVGRSRGAAVPVPAGPARRHRAPADGPRPSTASSSRSPRRPARARSGPRRSFCRRGRSSGSPGCLDHRGRRAGDERPRVQPHRARAAAHARRPPPARSPRAARPRRSRRGRANICGSSAPGAARRGRAISCSRLAAAMPMIGDDDPAHMAGGGLEQVRRASASGR